jgi:hypothetical protein
MKRQAIVLIIFGLSIMLLGALNFAQMRAIDDLRAELKSERDKQVSQMQDTVIALQLVQKYQNYLKEKGVPLP